MAIDFEALIAAKKNKGNGSFGKSGNQKATKSGGGGHKPKLTKSAGRGK